MTAQRDAALLANAQLMQQLQTRDALIAELRKENAALQERVAVCSGLCGGGRAPLAVALAAGAAGGTVGAHPHGAGAGGGPWHFR